MPLFFNGRSVLVPAVRTEILDEDAAAERAGLCTVHVIENPGESISATRALVKPWLFNPLLLR